MICVGVTDATVAGLTPTRTAAPGKKFVPTTVMVVPPATGPMPGKTPASVGSGAMKVKPAASTAAPAPGLVTATVCGPALALAAVVAVMVVAEWACTLVQATPPMVTAGWLVPAPAKPRPVMVTVVPPATGPEAGLTPRTAGARLP
jgi:hypothetical protein